MGFSAHTGMSRLDSACKIGKSPELLSAHLELIVLAVMRERRSCLGQETWFTSCKSCRIRRKTQWVRVQMTFIFSSGNIP